MIVIFSVMVVLSSCGRPADVVKIVDINSYRGSIVLSSTLEGCCSNNYTEMVIRTPDSVYKKVHVDAVYISAFEKGDTIK